MGISVSMLSPPSGTGCVCDTGEYITWSNLVGDFYDTVEGTQVINQNLYVGGCIYADCLNATCLNVSALQMQTQQLAGAQFFLTGIDSTNSNSMVYWTESVDIKDPGFCADLVFKSINNATVVFTDDFDPNVLNFTGSHRLLFKAKKHSRITPRLECWWCLRVSI